MDAVGLAYLDLAQAGVRKRPSKLPLGIAQLERLQEMLGARSRLAERYREALAGIEGLNLPCADSDGNVRGWFVFVVQLPHGIDRNAAIRALAIARIQSKPYLPAIHLMSFYRERFGHDEGEFPVCEGVAARSLALPFFPGMTEAQVVRVADVLAGLIVPERHSGPPARSRETGDGR